MKDALILHEALHYDPDVILYFVTLEEFVHVAPNPFPSLIKFFSSNSGALASIVADPPPGLAEPFEAYRPVAAGAGSGEDMVVRLREAGAFHRAAATRNAQRLVQRLGATVSPSSVHTSGRRPRYDCAATERDFASLHHDWTSWNILAFLEEIRKSRDVEVVVVNWPVAHEPVDGCYNIRYPADAFAQYSTWLREDAAGRGLHFVDLHDMLPPEEFVDSLHVSASGYRKIAERLEATLTPLLLELSSRHRQAASGGPMPTQ